MRKTTRIINRAILSALLVTGSLTTVMMLPAAASDRIERQIYQSGDFGKVAQHIRTDLRRQGFHVMNIKADDHDDKPAIKVYAKKDAHAFEMKYTYPDLKLIESKQKAWSQLWENDHQPDDEDKIKKSIYSDRQFESIKKKAADKLRGMGYEIDEIEADDYQRKGILKADVERGDVEYEVRLSYPNLEILTIEED